MRRLPGAELEMDLVQKASVLLFVSVFRRAFKLDFVHFQVNNRRPKTAAQE
jgi:hypothetical protein